MGIVVIIYLRHKNNTGNSNNIHFFIRQHNALHPNHDILGTYVRIHLTQNLMLLHQNEMRKQTV